MKNLTFLLINYVNLKLNFTYKLTKVWAIKAIYYFIRAIKLKIVFGFAHLTKMIVN